MKTVASKAAEQIGVSGKVLGKCPRSKSSGRRWQGEVLGEMSEGNVLDSYETIVLFQIQLHYLCIKDCAWKNPSKVGNFGNSFNFSLNATDIVAQYGENSIFVSLVMEKL